MTDRLIRDGSVAVLISPGHGAGWSTWANQDDPGLGDRMLFDPQIADVLLSGGSRLDRLSQAETVAVMKYPTQYLGGLSDLEVVMLPIGTRFRVREHDGNEWIETESDVEWKTA